ncbi:MAG: hypothetical protein MJ252_26660, partial [archaeon]|nr:hypothetical protein [archaeon]
ATVVGENEPGDQTNVQEKKNVIGSMATGKLLTVTEILNSNVPLPLKEDGTIDIIGKINFVKNDFFSDPNLLNKNLNFYCGEDIIDLMRASYNEADKTKIGVLVLTDFRLMFKFQNDDNQTNGNFPEDFFKIPLFNIVKAEIPKELPDPYQMEVTLRDTRTLKFFIYGDLNQSFFHGLVKAYNPEDKNTLFSFSKTYGIFANKIFNGWTIYDPLKEFNRQGVTQDGSLNLRYSLANADFSLCPTYPKLIVTHKDMTDEELKEASDYRTKNRLPAMSYYYKGNKDVPNPSGVGLPSVPSIWRSSQCKGGAIGTKKNKSDIKLFKCLDQLADRVYIMDCRPKLNAIANRATGGGYENVENYENTELQFCGIDNIHVARGALSKVYQLGLDTKIMENEKYLDNLKEAGWWEFVFLLLKYSTFISEAVQKNHSVLVHCSDGWDRTAQLTSLPQILLDPYFRTIEGFAVLIEKDWVSFGHQFGLRNGISLKPGKEDQVSPIFLQWLDAVHQLLHQFPNAFEFNDDLLLFLAKNYSINLYGTFMYNSEKERMEMGAKDSASVWSDVMKNKEMYLNHFYNKEDPVKILNPNYSPYFLDFWSELFMENNTTLKGVKVAFGSDPSFSFDNLRKYYSFEKEADKAKAMNNEAKLKAREETLKNIYNALKDKPEVMKMLDEKTQAELAQFK